MFLYWTETRLINFQYIFMKPQFARINATKTESDICCIYGQDVERWKKAHVLMREKKKFIASETKKFIENQSKKDT